MRESIKKPTVHSMKRRSNTHDYSRHGIYHVTISVAAALRQPLGRMAGRLDRPDGDCDAPHVELSAIGLMVEEELRGSICRYYPMVEVQEYVVMPEHLHFLLVVHGDLVSQSGKATHLGHVIAGFKLGCNRRYWAMTGGEMEGYLATESPGTLGKPVLGDSVAEGMRRSRGLQPLFDAGYCDVMPVDAEQLATQRTYIRANPCSRLMRTSHRAWLQPQRSTADTAVTLSALHGYLQRECPYQLTPSGFAELEQRLLVRDRHVVCDSYGNTELRRLLPVVCHRKGVTLFAKQKAHCLAAAAEGAVLVSARIAKGEQEIMDSALLSGYPVVRIEDNGFPDIYHPSADRIDDCAASLLLLVTPWTYQFRGADESVDVPFCKTMNCVAQALCRMKDDWWKQP